MKNFNLLPLLLNNLQHTIQDEQEVLRGKFYEKELIRVIWVWIRVQSSLFLTHLYSSFEKTRSVYLKVSCRSMWIRTDNGVEIFQIFYPSMYRNVAGEKLVFFDEKLYKSTEPHYLEPGLSSSIPDIVETMNTLIQGRNNESDTCIRIKVNRVTQKIEVYLANEKSSLTICSTDLGHIFGGDMRNGLGILMCGEGSHEPTFAYDIVSIHSLMIHTDIVDYIAGHTKAPLPRCCPIISKHKSSDIRATGQYMNYQNFSNLQFRRLFKNFFHSIHIDLRDTCGEKIPFVSVGITRLVLMFRKVSDIHLY